MCENLSPQTITRLSKEVRTLATNPPEGITYVPSDDDNMGVIICDLDGPVGTPYELGQFRVKLILGNDYPNSPPKGYFLTTIYHPNVAANGDICVNTLKKDWTPDVTLMHVFQVISCLLIVPFPESSLNEEAGKMFMEDYDSFHRRAKLMTSVHALKRSADASVCASGGSGDDDGAAADGEGDENAGVNRSGGGKGGAPGKAGKNSKDAKKKKALKRL